MTPPFSFELIVTGLCLITFQGPPLGPTGAHFQFLNAPVLGEEVCGQSFDDPHVPALTFNLEDLEAGTVYTSYLSPSGQYIGVHSLVGEDLRLVLGEQNSPFPFQLKEGRKPFQVVPHEPSQFDAFGWVASLANIDPRAEDLRPEVSAAIPHAPKPEHLIAARIRVTNGVLGSRELGRDPMTGDLIRWGLLKAPSLGSPKPDFPKALAGATALRLHGLTEPVTLVDSTGHLVLSFQSKNGGIVRVTAANLPQRKQTTTSSNYLSHFAWYDRLLQWKDGGECPKDPNLPKAAAMVISGSSQGTAYPITGSSVFCPPVTP